MSDAGGVGQKSGSDQEPVSVIIPTCNRADWLAGAMASVLEQDYPCFELIVVDDGSHDHTRQVVEQWQQRLAVELAAEAAAGKNGPGTTPPVAPEIASPALRYCRQENRGPAAARNRGIAMARYPLLAFLDCDDRFQPGKLARQATAMTAAPEFMLSHTDESWYRRGRHLNQKKRHRKEGGDLFGRSLELCVIGMSTVMLRRQLLAEVGLFDADLPCCEDYELWLRITCRHPVLLLDQPLTVKHGGRPDQLSVRHRVGIDRYRITALQKLLAGDMLSPAQATLARRELARKCEIYGRGCLKHGRRREGEELLALAHRLAPPR
ncbi:MAG: glycosyltransferase family A protein [Desulfurivibrio sp.]|nr:glycosyltransferase family A protein [Desulfurivibrio sp.]